MFNINITGKQACISELVEKEAKVDEAINSAVRQTGVLGEEIGKSFLSSHIFTGNAYASWQWMSTGAKSAIVTYFDAGIPHPTGKRSSLYFEALEFGRRAYIGSPNKIAVGTGGAYTYPHHIIRGAGGAHIVSMTAESLKPLYYEIMSAMVGGAL